MRIVIVGAGKLGYSIASLLTNNKYDVVVVDKDDAHREIVKNNLDVLTISGSGCSEEVLSNPEVEQADVLVATTDSDEVNIITCLMAKRHGIRQTVARIRNPDYDHNAQLLLRKDMQIDLVLNPERVLAQEIANILTIPSALDVDNFADGKVRMFETRLEQDSPYTGIPLKKLKLEPNMLIAVLFREGNMIIPHGDDMLMTGDNVYFVGAAESINRLEQHFNLRYPKLGRAMILGAGRTGRFLAPLLEQQGVFVKVIEKDRERCRVIAERLKSGLVLCGDGMDLDLLMDEGVVEADAVICLTDDDQMNMLLALMARHLGARKTVVRVARTEFSSLMEKAGVDIVLSARLLSATEVLRFVRGGGLVSVAILEGAQAEAIEITVDAGCAVENRSLMEAELPRECLVCGLLRKGEAIVPNGATVLRAEDHAIVFAQSAAVPEIMAMFSNT